MMAIIKKSNSKNMIRMKTTKITYWSFTGLFSLLMLGSSYADLFRIPEAKTIMTHLGYPIYIMWFIGVAKLL